MLTSLSRIGSATPKPLKSNEIRFCRASQLMPRADANIQLQRSRVWEGILNDTAPETSGCSGG